MGLYAFISNIWTGLAPPPPPKKRGRRPRAFDPDCIEPINHWYPGNRPRQQPRRLVETPTSANYPKFRIAKSVVAKGRKRCEACGALLKEEQSQDGGNGGSGGSGGSGRSSSGGSGGSAAPVTTVKSVRRRKSALLKALDKMEAERQIEREKAQELDEQIERELEKENVRAKRTLRGRIVEY
jgi:hypothetical protein